MNYDQISHGSRVVFNAQWLLACDGWLAPALTVTLKQCQSEVTVCTLTGVLTKDTTHIVKAALTRAQHTDDAHLIIDLSAVTCLDLTGLSTLLETRHRHTLTRGGRVAAVAMPRPSASSDPYAVIGLEASFDIYDELAAALSSCAGADSTP
jgi:anti-anti-sigma regulatory factor